MCVGLGPDPSIRLGVYGRAVNPTQTWLNGRVCGMKKPKLPVDAAGESGNDNGLFRHNTVKWGLNGDTFRGMR